MTKDTKLSELVINKLTTAQYDGIEEKDPNQLYIVTDAPGFEESRTNCITEIPQDIRLELVDGTLTLKTGSKVYVPNGAGVFDEVIISDDKSLTYTYNNPCFVWYDTIINSLRIFPQSICFSGNTAPTFSGNYAFWYDTTNNKCKFTGDAGSYWTETQSLPICIVTVSNGAISSIDQVFNGFGYIGSTAFVLPGVKGLIPNGRNADGTLKNIEFTVTKVLTRTETTNLAKGFVIDYNTFLNYDSGTWWSYDEEKNIYVHENDEYSYTPIVMCDTSSNGVISNWQPKTPFHAVDYNDFKKLDDEAVKVNGNQEINDVKTFNSTLQLKNNLSFRSYGSNDSGRLQFRAQPSDNVIRGAVAITDGYSTSGSGYTGFVVQMVAREGSTTSEPFNTMRVSNKGIEYIKEANDGTITGQYILIGSDGIVPQARLASGGTNGQVLMTNGTTASWVDASGSTITYWEDD